MGEIISKLVFDAIGKCIHPTHYRQIVETQSLNELTSEEQRILSEDQKHSFSVANEHYQKQRSREDALKGHECLQKLQSAKGSEVDEDVYERLGDSTSDDFLKKGITKHGFGKWTAILRDANFQFQDGRTGLE